MENEKVKEAKKKQATKKVIVKEIDGVWECKFVDSENARITPRNIAQVHRLIDLAYRVYVRDCKFKKTTKD